MRVLGEKRTYLLKTETGNTGKQGYAIQGVHKKVASLYLGKIVLDSEIWPCRS